jgi:Acetyltransferase (GNAT) domain
VTIAERYAPEDRDAWDDLVERSRAPHFFFRRGYMEYHADRFADHSLVVRRGDALIAAFPANRAGDEVVSHGGLTYGGLIAAADLTTTRTLAALEAVVDSLRSEGVRRLVYKVVPHIYHSVPSEEELYALFRLGARLIRRDVASAIRLDRRPRYSKGRRASVKAAASQGLTVERSTDYDGFMNVEAQTLERHNAAPVHTGAELRMLAERFPDHIKLTTASRDDRILGGAVVYETPEVAHVQYIGATSEGRDAGAVDVVIDALISQYTDAGKSWFDFGISTIEGGRVLNEGLVRNKESYGARGIVYDWYEVPL